MNAISTVTGDGSTKLLKLQNGLDILETRIIERFADDFVKRSQFIKRIRHHMETLRTKHLPSRYESELYGNYGFRLCNRYFLLIRVDEEGVSREILDQVLESVCVTDNKCGRLVRQDLAITVGYTCEDLLTCSKCKVSIPCN